MADEQFDSAPVVKSRAKGRLVPFVIVAVLMGAEGLGVFFLAKAISPSPVPALAAGAGGIGEGGGADGGQAYGEVELAECRPSNALSGKFISFHLRVSGLVVSANLKRAQQLAKDNRARFEDSVNTVIRGAEPKYFDEPNLDTIRRRLKHEFGKVLKDDGVIEEVLIPHFMQSGPGL